MFKLPFRCVVQVGLERGDVGGGEAAERILRERPGLLQISIRPNNGPLLRLVQAQYEFDFSVVADRAELESHVRQTYLAYVLDQPGLEVVFLYAAAFCTVAPPQVEISLGHSGPGIDFSSKSQ